MHSVYRFTATINKLVREKITTYIPCHGESKILNEHEHILYLYLFMKEKRIHMSCIHKYIHNQSHLTIILQTLASKLEKTRPTPMHPM